YQEPPGQRKPAAEMNAVSSGYFSTMRIPIMRGRDILDADTESSQRVAVVNELMAQTYWAGKDPIGHTFVRTESPETHWKLIGMENNSRSQLPGPISPAFYVPMAQDYRARQTLQVRTSSPTSAATKTIMEVVHSFEPAMAIFDVRTMTQSLNTPDGFMLFRLAAVIASSLGLLGLVLAIVGVYGVVSYSAAQRTHEIGIRIALGARRSQVLRAILRQGIMIVLFGSIFGILTAIAVARLVGSLLVGVSAVDPATYVGVSLLLAATALLASFIPALRATRVDPMLALRYE